MISLQSTKLKRRMRDHTWRCLEEILCARGAVLAPTMLPAEVEMAMISAKLRLTPNQIRMKMNDYVALACDKTFGNHSRLTAEVYRNMVPLGLLYGDVYKNEWSRNVWSAPRLFKGHEIRLLYSEGYSASPVAALFHEDLAWFEKKIDGYIDRIFRHTTCQHYVEHTNAIGLLDKIIVLTEDETRRLDIADEINPNTHQVKIQDFMGLFVSSADKDLTRDLNKLLGAGAVRTDDTLILLCPEAMEEMIRALSTAPSMTEMVDKVFGHEIGHLAFAFYYDTLGERENGWRIAERQANWLCSIAHDGKMDDLIEEVCNHQPPKYHTPLLLRDQPYPWYQDAVGDLYLR